MNRADILSLARKKMNEHGLVNWTVRFIKSKSVAGLCWTYRWNENPRYSSGRIELSTDYFDVFSDYDILDTILHEIAHALTETTKTTSASGRTRYSHHGPEWKAKAKEIGCSGRRCVRAEANRPKGKYRGVCPNGHETTRHRLTWTAKHNTSCEKCTNRYNSNYRFDWYVGATLVHSQAKPAFEWEKQADQIRKILQEVK